MTTILKRKCKYCGKVADERERQVIGKLQYISLECGHLIIEDVVEQVLGGREFYKSLKSTDGYEPFDFQVDDIIFGEESGIRFLNADEMGLGKTVVAALLLRLHREKMLPCLIVCKSRPKRQWFKELLRWVGFNEDGTPIILPQILDSSNHSPYPEVFNAFICTFDMFAARRRKNGSGRAEYPKWMNGDLSFIKSVILDETQMIKNSAAARTQGLRMVITASKAQHIIGCSGTPILNNAREYFTILNILRPEIFHNETAFIKDWCYSESTPYGVKVGAIKSSRIARFKEITSKFVIRHTREEVLPDLPKIFRQYTYHDLAEEVMREYDKEKAKFDEAYDEYEALTGAAKSKAFTENVLAYMSRMRHIVGFAKIDPVCEYVSEFLEETDRKIVLFHHHIDVGDVLEQKLRNMCAASGYPMPRRLHGGQNDAQAADVLRNFLSGPDRILIARTLAEGEGLNMQPVADMMQMEREWNPGKEQQAESRFPRPGATADKINAQYPLATGTIDEYMTELVENKRRIFKQTMGREIDAGEWEESSVLKELAEKLRMSGKSKFRLPKQERQQGATV